jgi:hypothetical protein
MTETFRELYGLKIKYIKDIEKNQQVLNSGFNSTNTSGTKTKKNKDKIVQTEWLQEQLMIIKEKIQYKLSLCKK